MDILSSIEKHLQGLYRKEEYPALYHQRLLWEKEKPLQGVRLLDATPLFNNTLLKYSALLSAGAEVTIGISDKLPHDPQCLSFVRGIGMNVITDRDSVPSIDVIMDCGAIFSHCGAASGYVELTRSGYYGYKDSEKPVFMTDSGRIKEIETSLGTGEGYFRAMHQLGFNDLTGKRLLVFGSGKVGRGIIICGLNRGMELLTVTDTIQYIKPDCPAIDFRDSAAVRTEIAQSDYIVSATGIGSSLAQYAEDLYGSDAIIANMGVEDEFGPDLPASRVLNAKMPLNFILTEPTRLRYIDATMALDNEGALYLTRDKNLSKGIITPPADMEKLLIDITRKNGIITQEIDKLYGTFNQ